MSEKVEYYVKRIAANSIRQSLAQLYRVKGFDLGYGFISWAYIWDV